jgi:hypothetical protein
MQDQRELLKLLQAQQTQLLTSAAKAGTLPTNNVLRRIADLELTIGALEILQPRPEKKR